MGWVGGSGVDPLELDPSGFSADGGFATDYQVRVPEAAQVRVVVTDNEGLEVERLVSLQVAPPVLLGEVVGMSQSSGGFHLRGWACLQGVSGTLGVGLFFDPLAETDPVVAAIANEVSSLQSASSKSQSVASEANCSNGGLHAFSLPISPSVALQYADRAAYVRVMPQSGVGSTLLPGSGAHVPNATPRGLLTRSGGEVAVSQVSQLSLVELSGIDTELGDTLDVTLKRNGLVYPGCVMQAPEFSCAWIPSGADVGIVSWEATLSDRFGAQSSSQLSVDVAPNANLPPRLALTSPVSSAIVIGRGGVIRFAGTAVDDDGRVDRVEVQDARGSVVLRASGSDLSSGGFNKSLIGLEVSGVLTVRAFDDRGASSNMVNVMVTVVTDRPATVTLLSPSEDAVYHVGGKVNVGQKIPVAISAEDPDGIALVRFVLNGREVATVHSPPYEVEWDAADLALGLHSWQAIVQDQGNVSTRSAERWFRVTADAKSAGLEPPPASNCRAGPVPIEPGSVPVTPGTWWNPQRWGTGWEFLLVPDNQIALLWFTYDRQGRPTWLISGPGRFDNGVLVVPLYSYRWNYTTKDLDQAAQQRTVGSVAIRLLEGDPTRVALRWHWSDQLPDSAPSDECIQDYFRASELSSGHTDLGPIEYGVNWAADPEMEGTQSGLRYANTAYNGGWMDNQSPGWGMYVTISQNYSAGAFSYEESIKAAVYDDGGVGDPDPNLGYPVWLLGVGESGANPPEEQTVGQVSLSYFESRYVDEDGASTGVPIHDCDVAACAIEHTESGSWTRWYGGYPSDTGVPEGSLIRQKLNVGDTVPGVTRFDRPLQPQLDWTSLIREGISVFEQVQVNSTYCELLNGYNCSVSINWLWRSGLYPNAGLFQLTCGDPDPNGGVQLHGEWQTPLPSQGERIVTLDVGDCIRFELRDGLGEVLFSTHEVRAVAVQRPVVSIMVPTVNQTLSAATHTTLIAQLQGFGQAVVTRVEFVRANNITLCEDSVGQAGEYRCTWANLPPGVHYLTARAHTAGGEIVVSPAVRLQVLQSANANEVLYYHHTNAQGSVVATTDWFGAPVHVAHYQPFGERFNDVGTPKISLGYTKQLHDDQLGLYYYGARYYDPLLTRFLSIDPAEFREDDWRTFNRYAYVNDSPLNYVDPDGRNALSGLNFGLAYADPRLQTRSFNPSARDLATLACGFCDVDGTAPAGSGAVQPMQTPIEVWAGGATSRGARFGLSSLGSRASRSALPPSSSPPLSATHFPPVAARASQKQLRHIKGTPQHADRGGGYLNSMDDANAVLEAYHSGAATILGRTKSGFPVVKVDGVTGTNVNRGAGILEQPTNVFMIKGTTSPSVVPINPYGVYR
jgi:RHS repeat-associated protein